MKRSVLVGSIVLTVFAVIAVLPSPLASYSDLQPTVANISGNILTIAVHNPTSGTEAAKIAVTVRLDNGLPESLMSTGFQVAASGTIYIQVAATRQVSSILDDVTPVPF